MQDMSATDSDAAEWQPLCNGDLPLIQGIWGEDGVISAGGVLWRQSARLHGGRPDDPDAA
jgi:hypothetical protein